MQACLRKNTCEFTAFSRKQRKQVNFKAKVKRENSQIQWEEMLRFSGK